MPTRTRAVHLDTLVIAGVILPPSGDNERWTIEYDEVASASPANSGDDIINHNPNQGATLTCTTYVGEVTNQTLITLNARQRFEVLSGTGAAWRGSARTTEGEIINWQDTTILTQSGSRSEQNASTVSWSLRLTNVARTMAAVTP